ncbi:MAG: glycoside hydrolase family 31 protein, partial [Puniceicoccales bacterium]
GLVDVTGPAGREWLRGKLKYLQEHYGIDGFKIDGGDFKYQPDPSDSHWHNFRGESGYSDCLLEVFEELVPNQCESRTAWLSQKRSILWRQGGKDSHWEEDNGLKAMVRLGMNLGLMGYDLSIPDMVPGRVQTLKSNEPLPTDELMVRWTEVSAFMPFLQFSYFPWNYAESTERIVRAYAQIHKLLESYLVQQSSKRSAPLMRPVWYDSPEVEGLYGVDDQFLLGDDLLVAPILEEGQTRRDVVIPPGEWVDVYTGDRVAEGMHCDVSAPCPGIPLFVRSRRMDLLELIQPKLAAISLGEILSGTTTTEYSAGLDRDLSVTG